MLDLEARVLLEVCGGCERIRTTALPASLTWITRMAIGLSLLAMPWFLCAELGWVVIPAAGATTLLLLVAELVANALEHPFGIEYDQLDPSVISSVIDRNTTEILGVS